MISKSVSFYGFLPAVPWRTERCDFRCETLFRCRKVSSPTEASFINNPGLCHDSIRLALLVRILVRVRVLVRSLALGSAVRCPCCGLDQTVWSGRWSCSSTHWVDRLPVGGVSSSNRKVLPGQPGGPGWVVLLHSATSWRSNWLTDCFASAKPVIVSMTLPARRINSCRLEEERHRPPVVGAGFTAFSQSKHSSCWGC